MIIMNYQEEPLGLGEEYHIFKTNNLRDVRNLYPDEASEYEYDTQ